MGIEMHVWGIIGQRFPNVEVTAADTLKSLMVKVEEATSKEGKLKIPVSHQWLSLNQDNYHIHWRYKDEKCEISVNGQKVPANILKITTVEKLEQFKEVPADLFDRIKISDVHRLQPGFIHDVTLCIMHAQELK